MLWRAKRVRRRERPVVAPKMPRDMSVGLAGVLSVVLR